MTQEERNEFMSKYVELISAEMNKYSIEEWNASYKQMEQNFEDACNNFKVFDKNGNEYPKGRFTMVLPNGDEYPKDLNK